MTGKNGEDKQTRQAGRDRRLVLFGMAWGIVWPAMIGLILYVTSGRWRWPLAWAYLGIYSALLIGGSFFAIHRDPDFAEERTRAKEGTKAWDKLLSGPLFSPIWLALYVLAGLDRRYDWSPDLTPVAIGAVLVAGLGYLLAVWAMASNKFYGRYVRIQHDRGHLTVTTGPYRLVRHPGYAGLCLFMVASALALESLWALIPAVMIVIVLVVRTSLEDRTLLTELPGYAEYARRTRFRLLPGLW
jgi:protein-S-isoprenylcysteine O-methyltransferase Ste14